MGLPALKDLPARALIALVQGYRLFLKAWIGNACRLIEDSSGGV